jgi:hypothetical protein
MKRGLAGHGIPIPSVAGEPARGLVPNPWRPLPKLELDGGIRDLA